MDTRRELTLDDDGLWVVRSMSETVYVLDLRGAPLLLRQPGPRSSRGPHDGEWVPLESMSNVAIGSRGYYLTDPGSGPYDDYRWWYQRRITSIEAISEDDIPAILASAQAGTDSEADVGPSRSYLTARRERILGWLAARGVTEQTAEVDAPVSWRVGVALAELARIEEELDAADIPRDLDDAVDPGIADPFERHEGTGDDPDA